MSMIGKWPGVTVVFSTLAVLASCTAGPKGRNTVRYADGTVRWTVETRNGQPHGASVTHHANGKIASKGTYAEGRKHGLFLHYSPAGELEVKRGYHEGVLIWTSKTPHDPTPAVVLRTEAPRPTNDAAAHSIDAAAHNLVPSFRTLDKARRGVAGDIQIGAHRIGGSGNDSRIGRRIGIYGQFVPNRIGGYVAFSTAWFGESSNLPASQGKLVAQAGAILNVQVPHGALIARLGVFSPLGADDLAGFATNAAVAFERYADVATTFPRARGIRVSGSFQGRRGAFFYRSDAGLDLVLNRSESDGLRLTDTDFVLARANLGIGVGNARVATSLEFVTAYKVSDADTVGSRFGATLALVTRLQRGRVNPSIGIISPAYGERSAKDLVFIAAVDLPLEAWQ